MPEPLSPERIAFLRSLTETEHYWLLPSQGKQLMGEIDRLTDALAASQATVAELRRSLRYYVFRSYEYDGKSVRYCRLCGEEREDGEPESHSPGCLAALPQEAP